MNGNTTIADVEFEIAWSNDQVSCRERRFVSGIDLALDRVAGNSLAALTAASSGQSLLIAEGMLCGSRDPDLCFSLPRTEWPLAVGGHRTEARRGRWLPRLVLAGHHGIAAGDREPLRIAAVTAATVDIDLNPPLAGRQLTVSARRVGSAAGTASAGGRELLSLLASGGPGMQASIVGSDTDFLDAGALAPADAEADAAFYREPRFVDHLDAVALAALQELHGRFLAPGIAILDLMASCNSHLGATGEFTVCGLGMNAAEMARNPHLTEHRVHDLNEQPRLPYPDASFDLVLCALSVEYLTRPVEVFADIARVLKPGGTFLVTFSERWFPPKAIRVWSELHPFERMGLVLDYLRHSGAFEELHTESLRGLPRPRDDKYIRMTRLSDPIYAVWGKSRR